MLQILCGPDRTANSMRILDQICENARAGVAGQILIVPEQYSHETERALGLEPVVPGARPKKGDDEPRPVRAVQFSNFIIQ